MGMSHFFIRRPIFATVIWLIVLLTGIISYFSLPIEQYPEIVPPTIVVSASYPGADAQTIAKTIATPLEQEINGVEDAIYISSQATNDGSLNITITFAIGTDLDKAQVLVQNRVAIAEPRLPQEVRQLGITTRKNSPDLMLVINMFSPDDSLDQTYIANYATLNITDKLARINGVGDLLLFGASQYAMRIWLDPDRIASLNLTSSDIVSSLRAKNMQVAAGTLGAQPQTTQPAFELTVRTKGRLISADEFANIIIKNTPDGRIVRVKDIARVELGAASYASRGYISGAKAIAIPIFQRPGSNALSTSDQVEALMQAESKNFPQGLDYKIVYNPTKFIEQSMHAVYSTIIEAVFLVVLVIVLFLQSWRSSIIPIVAIPLSLIGTFTVMAALGFSINNLTLFGLVLSIGIVVDDAIVVVENIERLLSEGMSPGEAAHKSMDEVGGALIAMGLVLVAVFLPVVFIEGISGRFYQEFALIITTTTVLSVLVSLTLSPALAALYLREHKLSASGFHPIATLYRIFNAFMERITKGYNRLVALVTRHNLFMIILYIVLIALTSWQFQRVPSGFIPQQDQGYFIIGVQLPPGSALARTDDVIKKVIHELNSIEGITDAVGFAGFNGATFTSASNAGAVFPVLDSFENREQKNISYHKLFTTIQEKMNAINEAYVVVIPPPPVRGVGSGGGFKMMVQDRSGQGYEKLYAEVMKLSAAANQLASTNQVFSFYDISTPELYFHLDRDRAERLRVDINDVFTTLGIYLGSLYVNDFNFLGRTYQVTAQADAPFRNSPDDLLRLRVRSASNTMVPLGSLGTVSYRSGPARQPRYNLYPAAEVQGDTAPGFATSQTLTDMENLAQRLLPPGFSFEWTDLAYQQKLAGDTGLYAFFLGVLFVFLLLAALYESWLLPLAIILIVPMCLLSAITGISLMGLDNNILSQVGFLVLVGLASKNAILIVEFARENERQFNMPPVRAALAAAKVRLRPILMTSLAFILGVLPMAIATGAGAEMRQALGVTVFSGMLGVTFFGLVFTPVFYVLCRQLGKLTGIK